MGEGLFRLYAGPDGKLVGYSWSVTKASEDLHEIKNVKARRAMAKVVKSCSRWAAEHFDPSKMDKAVRDRGAAHHLMTEGDDAATRMRKVRPTQPK